MPDVSREMSIREEIQKAFESHVSSWANNFEKELARVAFKDGAKWMGERICLEVENRKKSDPPDFLSIQEIRQMVKELEP